MGGSDQTSGSLKKKRVKKIAFGWFGTLVDPLPGMQKSLIAVEGERRGSIDLVEMTQAWDRAIKRRYRDRYVVWPRLALAALEEVCESFSVDGPELDAEAIQEWVPHWPVFADQSALGKIGGRFKCAVLTQLDASTLAPCLPGLARVMDRTVTSDLSRSYKPSPQYFKLLRVQLKLRRRDELLVVSADRETDLEPAAAEGYQTLWVDRSGDGSDIRDLYQVSELLW